MPTVKELVASINARAAEAEANKKPYSCAWGYYSYERLEELQRLTRLDPAHEEYQVSIGKGHRVTVLALNGEPVSVTIKNRDGDNSLDVAQWSYTNFGGKKLDTLFTVWATVVVTGGRKAETLRALGQATHRCSICGTPLTDPDSMARGIGPECVKHIYVGFEDRVEVAAWKDRVAQLPAEVLAFDL
jgi:hypothetical protein